MREAVGSLTPSVAATLDWLRWSARAARTTALVSTRGRSGAGSGVVFATFVALSGSIPWKLYRYSVSVERARRSRVSRSSALREFGNSEAEMELAHSLASSARVRRSAAAHAR